MTPYKFVKWEIPTLNSISNSPTYSLWSKLENGERLTREEKNRAYGLIHDYMGWRFYFENLSRFLVKIRGYGWQEVYAYDKTCVRANLFGVIEIIKA